MWLLLGAVSVAVLVTYARLPAGDLYHVSRSGLAGGGGRALASRAVPGVASRRTRRALTAYLALLLTYGLGNVANDFWLEQVVKRGSTGWQIPSVTEPRLTPAWGVVVLAAGVLCLVSSRPERRRAAAPPVEHALGPTST